MSRIEISQAFTMPREDLKGELDQLTSELGEQLEFDCDWLSDDCLDFRRSGVAGQINIGDDEFNLTVELGFLMTLFQETIEQEILAFMEQRVY